MKQLIILMLLTSFSLISYAQTLKHAPKDSTVTWSQDLTKAGKLGLHAKGLTLLGVSMIAFASTQSTGTNTIMIGGYVCVGTGFILEWVSFSRLKRAGEKAEETQ